MFDATFIYFSLNYTSTKDEERLIKKILDVINFNGNHVVTCSCSFILKPNPFLEEIIFKNYKKKHERVGFRFSNFTVQRFRFNDKNGTHRNIFTKRLFSD